MIKTPSKKVNCEVSWSILPWKWRVSAVKKANSAAPRYAYVNLWEGMTRITIGIPRGGIQLSSILIKISAKLTIYIQENPFHRYSKWIHPPKDQCTTSMNYARSIKNEKWSFHWNKFLPLLPRISIVVLEKIVSCHSY